MNVGADITNGANTEITNAGTDLTVGGTIDNTGNLIITNNGTGSLLMNGTVDNDAIINIINSENSKDMKLNVVIMLMLCW